MARSPRAQDARGDGPGEGGGGDTGDITAGRSCARKTTDRQQALIVEHHVHEIPRLVPRQRGEPAEIHQDGSVTIENNNLQFRSAQGNPQAK